MGSILSGDLDDRLVNDPDVSTTQGRRKLAAGRLSLLLLVMATESLGHAAQRVESEEAHEQAGSESGDEIKAICEGDRQRSEAGADYRQAG